MKKGGNFGTNPLIEIFFYWKIIFSNWDENWASNFLLYFLFTMKAVLNKEEDFYSQLKKILNKGWLEIFYSN